MVQIKNPLTVMESLEPPTPGFDNIYQEISWYADKGEAQERYPVGTMIDVNTGVIVSTELSDHLTLRIVGYNGIIQEEGGTQKQGRPQLLAVRLYPTAQKFGSADTTAQTQWNNCTLRTWMNATYLNTLPKDFRDAVKTSIVSTCPNGSTSPYTTFDKLYIPSATEVGGVGSGATYVEGTRFQYFGDGSASNDSSALNNLRKATTSNGTTREWWLRSVGLHGGSRVWYVLATGALNSGNYSTPTDVSFVRPACNL